MDVSPQLYSAQERARQMQERLAKAQATIERVRQLCRTTIQHGEFAVHVDDVFDRLNGEEA
jgi:hypothetical protein